MKLSKKYMIGLLALFLTAFLMGCGEEDTSTEKNTPIIFADEGWDSVRFHNQVASIIIEEGYGYETDEISGSDAAIWKGLEQGDVDVHMEAWTENIQEMYNQAIDSGNVVKLSVNFDDNYQGLYVPTYVIEGDPDRGIEPMAPDLEYITDLPDYKDVFIDPENPDMGMILGATPGWTVDEMIEEAINDYGIDETFNYVSPGSEAAINASLVRAYENGEAWVGYNYEPNWIMGMYDMTPLGEKDPDGVIEQIASQDINIVAHVDLVDQAPDVIEFLENYETTSDIASEALTYIQEEEASTHEAAMKFLKEHEDLWTTWVPEDVADKVKEAIE